MDLVRRVGFFLLIACAVALGHSASHAADTLRVSVALPVTPADTAMTFYPSAALDGSVQLLARVFHSGGGVDTVTQSALWSSSNPLAGSITPSRRFVFSNTPATTRVTATFGGLQSDTLQVHTAAKEYDDYMLAADDPRDYRTLGFGTPDDSIYAGVGAMVTAVVAAGIDGDGWLAWTQERTRFYDESRNSGGIAVGDAAGGVTFLPGISFRNWGLIYVYGTKTHSVFFADYSKNMRDLEVTSGGGLNAAGQLAFHELLHSVIHHSKTAVGDFNNEEDLVQEATALVTTAVFIKNNLTKMSLRIAKVNTKPRWAKILGLTGGQDLMNLLKIKDDDENGLPDFLDVPCPENEPLLSAERVRKLESPMFATAAPRVEVTLTDAHLVSLATVPGSRGNSSVFSDSVLWFGRLSGGACFPGYGNAMNEVAFASFALSNVPTSLTYSYRVDAQSGADFAYVIVSRAGEPGLLPDGRFLMPGTKADRDTLAAYTGFSQGQATLNLSAYQGTVICLIFNAVSNNTGSDGDCGYNSLDGLFQLDDVAIDCDVTRWGQGQGENGWTLGKVAPAGTAVPGHSKAIAGLLIVVLGLAGAHRLAVRRLAA